MDIYLMRHGESFSNRLDFDKAKPEETDADLTPEGHQQAEVAARWLLAHTQDVDAIFASTMRRAQQTAGYVGEALALEVQSDHRLREVTTCYDDQSPIPEALLPTGWHPFSRSEFPHRPLSSDQNGDPVESWSSFRNRTGAFIHDLTTRDDLKTVIVVAHGGVINAIIDMIFNVGVHRRADVRMGYTAISKLNYNGRDGYVPWYIRFLAQTSHLDVLNGANND